MTNLNAEQENVFFRVNVDEVMHKWNSIDSAVEDANEFIENELDSERNILGIEYRYQETMHRIAEVETYCKTSRIRKLASKTKTAILTTLLAVMISTNYVANKISSFAESEQGRKYAIMNDYMHNSSKNISEPELKILDIPEQTKTDEMAQIIDRELDKIKRTPEFRQYDSAPKKALIGVAAIAAVAGAYCFGNIRKMRKQMASFEPEAIQLQEKANKFYNECITSYNQSL